MANPFDFDASQLSAANRSYALGFVISELRAKGNWTGEADPSGAQARSLYLEMIWDEFKDEALAWKDAQEEAARVTPARIDE